MVQPESPRFEICNGVVTAGIYSPDPDKGFYRGTRFDWSGTIYKLECLGHTYFKPWFLRFDPNIPDITYDPALDGYAAGPASANIGPVEEFRPPLGYDDPTMSDTFLKVGVGMLRKLEHKPYAFYDRYEFVNGGGWTASNETASAHFAHELKDSSGYGYLYTKTLRLPEGKSQLILEHSLKNTGRRLIETAVYNHNFIVIDDQPTGPDFSIKVPFEIKPARDTEGLVETRGTEVAFRHELRRDQHVMIPVEGFSGKSSDYDIRVENRRTRGGLRITSDRALSRLMVWAIRPVNSPEAFIDVRVEPGDEFSWRISYEFYNLP